MAEQTRTGDDTGPSPRSPEQVRRGRRMALLLFAVGFGPMIFATVMFYTGWFNPQGHTNNGALVSPAVPVSELELEDADGRPLADRFGPEMEEPEWMMVVAAGRCEDACEELLYLSRQVNIALGKNADRMTKGAYLGEVPADLESRWGEEYASTLRLQSRNEGEPAWPEGVSPGERPEILLVDPFGNIMMRYDNSHTGKQLLEDLKHLMKLSQIG